VPKVSIASIYLPAVQGAYVLTLAARIYTIHNLTASDAHTLQCQTGGATYIPIPQGAGPNYAGPFSVQLPLVIKYGQEFKIVVRRITSSFENFQANNPVSPPSEAMGVRCRPHKPESGLDSQEREKEKALDTGQAQELEHAKDRTTGRPITHPAPGRSMALSTITSAIVKLLSSRRSKANGAGSIAMRHRCTDSCGLRGPIVS
jgi:hypothetical protein